MDYKEKAEHLKLLLIENRKKSIAHFENSPIQSLTLLTVYRNIVFTVNDGRISSISMAGEELANNDYTR